MVHTRTAIDEAYGRSLSATITSNADLPLNWGPGGARFLLINASAGLSVRVPRATYLRTGAAIYTIYNNGSNAFTVTDWGGNTIQTVTAGNIREFHLLDNSTVNGLWTTSESFTASAGTSLGIGRVPMNIDVGYSGTNISLRKLADKEGYTGDYPLALKVEIPSTSLIDSASTSIPSLQTGVFFPGTTIMLVNKGTIFGRGGVGGQGGLLGTPGVAGQAGGKAVQAQTSITIVNLGFIGGGGGGGGGGGSNTGSGNGGGGGGGGRGQQPGNGGPGSGGGQPGQAATGAIFGLGGSGAGTGAKGGDGGNIGQAGFAGSNAAGGGAGGAGGAAGHCLFSVGGGVIITKQTAGTLYGPEVLT